MNTVLTTEDFLGQGRSINMEGFTNFDPSLTRDQIVKAYPNHLVIPASKVKEFTQNTLEKAGNDELNKEHIINKAKDSLSKLKRVRFDDGRVVHEIYMLEKAEEGDEDDLQKAHIDDAIGYSDFGFTKSGKEIKEKLASVNVRIQSKANTHLAKMQENLTASGKTPTEPLDEWELRGLEDDNVEYKKFPYNCTYVDTPMASEARSIDQSGITVTKEVANCCRDYNDQLRKYLDCVKDLKKSLVFTRNLDDKKMIKLNLNQLSALGF